MDRRRILGTLSALGLMGCSRPAGSDGTYAVVNDFSEIALAPDGGSCVLHPMLDPATFLLFQRGSAAPRTITFPRSGHWVRDLTFAHDGRTIFFTAGPPPFDTKSTIFRLDLESLTAQAVETGYDYNRVPALSLDGARLAYAARAAGGASLSMFEMTLADRRAAPFSPALCQSVFALENRPDGTLVVGCVPGTGPFDSLKIDEANGFQRMFLLARDGALQGTASRFPGASALALQDADADGRILLTARYDRPARAADIRLAILEADLASHRFVDVSGPDGHVITGAAIAALSGDVVARSVVVGGEHDGLETIAFEGDEATLLSDLVGRALPSVMSL